MSAEQGKLLDIYLARLQSSDIALDDMHAEDLPDAEELRDLLTLASQAHQALGPSDPDSDYIQNSELRILNQLRARARKAPQAEARKLKPRLSLAPALISIFLGIALLAGTVGVASASAAALPGDSLYPVKRGIEDARLFLTISAAGDLQLLGEYSDERLREIEALTDAGRTEDFDQALEAYVTSVDRLSDAAQSDALGELPGVSQDILEQLTRHVEVLETVQAKVPAQAQGAIQSVIDSSLEHAQSKEDRQPERIERQESNSEQQEERREEREQERNLRQAEQIARQYEVTSDLVLEVFEDICERDWKCVRDFYKEAKRDKDGPNP